MLAAFIFWFSLALIFYTYLGYLALSIVWGWAARRPVRKRDIYPGVSLVIPAFNEEKVIKEKLENALWLDYPRHKLEIIVCSESTDRTNEIVSRYSAKGVRLISYPKRRGKSRMIYEAMPRVNGEVIVFSDANAMYEKNALRKLVRSFADKNIGAVLGRLVVSNPRDSAVSGGEHLYKRYERLLRSSNSRTRSVLGVDGSIFAVRRSLYCPITPDRGDDFELVVRVLIKGFGVVFEPEAVSHEKASVRGILEIKRKIRIVSWFFNSSLILMKEMAFALKWGLVFRLVSHKICRWMSPLFCLMLLGASAALSEGSRFYSGVLWVQILFYALGVSGWLLFELPGRRMPAALKLPFYFLVFNAAFFLGVFSALLLGQKPFWDKSQR